jgi:DnaJ-class molecular chaperone
MCSVEIIQNLREEFNLPIEVCDRCSGDGEYRIFCGHYATVNCEKCKGKGYLNVSKMSKKSKTIRT